MKVYEHPDMSDAFRCPVCGTGSDEPVVKVPYEWDDLGPILSVQVHLRCLDLRAVPSGVVSGACMLMQQVKYDLGAT